MRITQLITAAIVAATMALPAAATAQDNHLEPGKPGKRYIVTYRGDAAQGRSAVRAARAQVALSLGPQRAEAAYIPESALPGLRRNPNVAAIEPDNRRYPLAESTPWGISMVGATQVAQATAGDVSLCIIDSGYDATHGDLPGTGVTFTTDSGTGDPKVDGCGHGTHVAGTVAAVGGNGIGVVGVNPAGGALRMHIVKVFSDGCGWTYSSSLVHALNQCTAGGGRVVVNKSLGGSHSSSTENRAFTDAFNTGRVLPVAAAGNAGTTAHSYPASYSAVVSVAAVDSQKRLASFSQRNSQVELSAPGVGVLSTVPGGRWESWNGTSMATPHVAGVAALVWNLAPNASAADVRNAMASTAEDLGAAGRDSSFGFGLVRAKAALDALAPTTPADPPADPPQCAPIQATETSCADGLDNDCDGQADSADADCQVSCLARGARCTSGAQCCSGSCAGKRGAKVCK